MDSTNGIFKTIQLQPCHCEAKPKQSIIKHTEILTMESKKARFHIIDCHEVLRSLAMTKPKRLLLRHCEAKPKQSIIKHTEILTMESKKARFHIVDCHESRCDSRNDEIANFLSLRGMNKVNDEAIYNRT